MKIVADENIPLLMECFGAMGKVVPLQGRNITAEDLVDADALLVRSVTNVDEQLIKNSPLSFIGTCTAGADHLDHHYLSQKPITFTNAPGCNAISVVEYVIAALDVLAERDGFDIRQRKVGIVGKGQVGDRLYRTLEQFEVEVYANDPLCEPDDNVRFMPLDELIQCCDVICLHTPLTTAGEYPTRHLIDKGKLSAMKSGTILVSAGRGPVIDNAALKAVLEGGKQLSVVMDVWEFEPEVDPDLVKLVDIATPHIAGYSLDGKIRGTEMIYRSFCQHFGLPARVRLGAVTPIPAVKKIGFTDSAEPARACSTAIRTVYDIRRDDAQMRKLSKLADAERRQEFDRLRKDYAERREFKTLSVLFNNTDVKVRERLAALGFTLRT